MDPYKSPEAETQSTSTAKINSDTFTCGKCGSKNIEMHEPYSNRPNLIIFIVFGWLYLLIRLAFLKKTIVCVDCGEKSTYKSVGSWIAMGVLILLILLILTSGN